MAGAIMEKVWGLFGMEPAEDRDEEVRSSDIISWNKLSCLVLSKPDTEQEREINNQQDPRKVEI